MLSINCFNKYQIQCTYFYSDNPEQLKTFVNW